MLYLFVGYLFVFFNFSINGFDLLSNGIGYLLIYMGISRYAEEAPSLEKAKPWACGMIVVYFVSRVIQKSFGLALYALWWVVDFFMVCGAVYLLYLVIQGIAEIQNNRGVDLNSGKLMKIWRYQAIFSIGAIQLTWIPIDGLRALPLLFGLLGIVANIFFLVELYGVKQKLEVVQ